MLISNEIVNIHCTLRQTEFKSTRAANMLMLLAQVLAWLNRGKPEYDQVLGW